MPFNAAKAFVSQAMKNTEQESRYEIAKPNDRLKLINYFCSGEHEEWEELMREKFPLDLALDVIAWCFRAIIHDCRSVCLWAEGHLRSSISQNSWAHFMCLGVGARSKLNINNGELGSWKAHRAGKGYCGLVCKYNFNNISFGIQIDGVLRRTQDEAIPRNSHKSNVEAFIVWTFCNFYNPKLNLFKAFPTNVMPNISTRNP